MHKEVGMKYLGMIAVLFVFISGGCKQSVMTRPEAQQVPQQKEMQQGGQQTKAPEKITEQKVEAIDSRDLQSKQGNEKEGMFQDILFVYDKYDVKDSFKPVVKAVASWMLKNPAARLSIEGHCDERGTNEYNLALGERRARAVMDHLSAFGIAAARVETISYGEEKPLCQEHSEECWTKNRRAHFFLQQIP